MIYVSCVKTSYNERDFEEALDNMVVDWCSYEDLEETLDIVDEIDDTSLTDLDDYREVTL